MPGDDRSQVTVYPAEMFAQYNPVTVADILDRIPGAIRPGGPGGGGPGGGPRRGLRSNTGSILINGDRLTGKSANPRELLSRIAAERLERIELIRGNVLEIDADAGNRVINIILKDDGATAAGTWNIRLIDYDTGPMRFAGEVTYGIDTPTYSVNMSFDSRPQWRPRTVSESIFSPTEVLLRTDNRVDRRRLRSYTGRVNGAYNFQSGMRLQLNGFYDRGNRDDTELRTITPLGPMQPPPKTEEETNQATSNRWELTSDIELPLSQKWSMDGLVLHNSSDDNRTTITSDIGFASPIVVEERFETNDRRETIGRLRFKYAQSPRVQWEAGIEGARNTLDTSLVRFEVPGIGPPPGGPPPGGGPPGAGPPVGGGPPGPPIGPLEPVDIFNPDSFVREWRTEPFVSVTWKPTRQLEFRPGLAVEQSFLAQEGSDVSLNRDFTFPKPTLDAWYRFRSGQVWFSFARDVGQIDFRDFIADVDSDDDDILPGNPNLAPERSWDFEIGYEHRLARQAGLVSARAFFSRVNEVADQIPFGPFDSQPGNIGSGNRYGVELESSLRLANLGLLDATLNGTVIIQGSDVTDPFTGEKRRFRGQEPVEIRFSGQHDIAEWDARWGFEVDWEGSELSADWDEVERETRDVNLVLFVERQMTPLIRARLQWFNATRFTTNRFTEVFAPNRAIGQLDEIQRRRDRPGRAISLRFSGTF